MTTVDQQAKIAASFACPDIAVLRIPLHRLRLPRNIPAGMSLVRIGAIADTLLNGGEVWDPALVRCEGDGWWSITDGKHRYMASYVAGMPDLLCTEEP